MQPGYWPQGTMSWARLACQEPLGVTLSLLACLAGSGNNALPDTRWCAFAGGVGAALLLQVAFLADGIPGLIAAPLGGMLSDQSAAKHPHEPEARLVLNTLIAMITMPSGLLIYAWAMHTKAHMGYIFFGMALISFGCGSYLPGLFGYLTTLKQSAAAAASAAVQSLMSIIAGVIVITSAVAARALRHGPWFTILAGIQLAVTLFAYLVILRKQGLHRHAQDLPEHAVCSVPAAAACADAAITIQ